MYWSIKYKKAKKYKKQLIGDKVMRDTFFRENPDAVAVEEIRLKGVQADIVEFRDDEGGHVLIGYEVKSDRDSLDRLEEQLKGYLAYCNYVYVLATYRHSVELLKILDKEEFNRVGVKFYEMGVYGKYFVEYKEAVYRDLRGTGLNTEWISRDSKLYRWKYLLEEVWGEDYDRK